VAEGESQSEFIKSVSGSIEVSKHGLKVCEISGDHFLNLFELLNKTQSIFSFKALSEVVVWKIQNEPFNLFVKEELKLYLKEK